MHVVSQGGRQVSPQTPLWCVFFLQGVIPNAAILAAVLAVSLHSDLRLRVFLLVAYLLHTYVAVGAIWTRTEKLDRTWPGALARGMCVAWVLNSVMLSLFLALPT